MRTSVRYIQAMRKVGDMKIYAKIFDLANGKYANMSELARAMEISPSYVYRVQHRTRSISKKFIIGAMKAFPGNKFDDLFYFDTRLEPVNQITRIPETPGRQKRRGS